ncbi:flagellar hook-length control protein FliK, partial [Massilia terrae]
TLSPAAQVLGSVLAAVLKLDQPAKAVAARAPVLATINTDPAALAPALRQALEQSGLFYESHVAAWAEGRRELASLAFEPQMRDRPANPADPAPAQLINLQLAAQEQDRVAWQGQLWPGQPMQWEIRRDAPQQDGGAAGGEPEPTWQSRLRLRFALFGELDATVVLHGGQVAIRIGLADEGNAALLRSHTASLQGALAAAGTSLSALAIVNEGADE